MVAVSTATHFGTSRTAGDIYTLTGNGTGNFLGDGGAATSAEIDQPGGVAVDSSGNLLYISDSGNCNIRMIAASNATHFGTTDDPANDIYSIAGEDTWAYSGTAAPPRKPRLLGPQAWPWTPREISISRIITTASSEWCRPTPLPT